MSKAKMINSPYDKRILCIGDSLTAGITDAPNWVIEYTFGYRGYLYDKLLQNGKKFYFVGQSKEPFCYQYGASFGCANNILGSDLNRLDQNQHRGYSGCLLSQLTLGGFAGGSSNPIPKIEFTLAQDRPNIILLQIGTNGLTDAQNYIDEFITKVFGFNSSVVLIVAKIPPRASFNQAVIDYNNFLQNKVDQYFALGNNIYIVDQYQNFILGNGNIDQTLFSYDNTHLNKLGYNKLCDTWYTELIKYL